MNRRSAQDCSALISWRDIMANKIERKLQLLRGTILRMRGAKSGCRLGIGRCVRLCYPQCFTAGNDVSIGDYSFLDCLSERGVKFGGHTSIDRNLWLHCGGTSGDCRRGYFEIGEFSFIGCNAVIGAGGGIRIGNHVLIGQCVNMHSENHRFSDILKPIDNQGLSHKGIVIEDNVWVGSKTTILDGVTIGYGAVIAAGAVVTSEVPPFSVVAGVPARLLSMRGAPV
jgi:acetyltransferase-like isoleucine patch superfamily enzyme